MDYELERPGPVDPDTPDDHADLDVPDWSEPALLGSDQSPVHPDTAEESLDDRPHPEDADGEAGGPGPGWIPA